MEKIFITGATGLIGRRVVESQMANGNPPTCLLRPGRKLHGVPEEYIVQGDILDPKSLSEGMRAQLKSFILPPLPTGKVFKIQTYGIALLKAHATYLLPQETAVYSEFSM